MHDWKIPLPMPGRNRPLAEVIGGRTVVPLAGGGRRRYVNLDNAASTPVLRQVWKRLHAAAEWYAGVHRGTGAKGYMSTALFEKCRETILNFAGGDPDYHTVVFVRNTTEALNKLASACRLRPGDMIITTQMEHHSNDLPWRRVGLVQRVKATADGRLDLAHLEHLLSTHRNRVRIVTVTGASNVTGCVNDIHSIAEMSHRAGALMVVDAAQLAPHRPIRMLSPSDPRHIDCLALSGHKLYAPFGAGALIAPKHIFPSEPQQPGGGTVTLVTPTRVRWAPLPSREEAGSPNVLGTAAMAIAVQELSRIGMNEVAAHENRLLERLLPRLAAMPHVEVYGPPGCRGRVGVVSFNVKDLPHALTGAYLACECGIGVRTGCFCAQPYVQHLLGISEAESLKLHRQHHSNRAPLPGMVRASFGIYNTLSDVDYLLDCVGRLESPKERSRLLSGYTYVPEKEGFFPADGDQKGSGFLLPWEETAGMLLRRLHLPVDSE